MIVAFDQYQRYKHIEEIINLVRKDSNFTILEVGANEHKNLQNFLPLDDITYLDIEVPNHLLDDPQYIQADATNMPEITERTYDFVIALDVFEHIPAALRENFIKELHRVSKKGVIIAAPFNSKAVENAEVRANNYFMQLYGSGFRWLEEHRENGLPDFAKTIDCYLENKFDFIYFEHGSLDVWEKMIDLHFLFANKSQFHESRFLIDDYYNQEIYPIDYGEECYRKFFISNQDTEELSKIKNWIDGRVEKSKENLQKKEHLKWLENQLKNAYSINKLDELKITQNQMSIKQEELQASFVEGNRRLEEAIKSLDSFQRIEEQLKSLENLNIQTSLRLEEQAKRLEVLDKENQEYKHQIELKDNHITNIETLNNTMKSTKGWRALEKLRRIKLLVSRNKKTIVPKVINKVKNEGLKSTIHTIERKLHNELKEITYDEWFRSQELSSQEIEKMKMKIKNFEKKPLISVVVPTYNTPLDLLDEAIKSLQNQIYNNWELCICDDQSPNKEVWSSLQRYANIDNRIKIIQSPENLHIAGATNLAISLAKGEYIGFLDHDDILTNDALFEVVKALNEHDADLIYSDEDKLEMDGTFTEPFFKPDWSPDYLLSTNYICHFAVYRKTIGDKIGWINSGYDGAQDYDFVLRFTEQTQKIHHISKVLYHWRKIPGSTADSFGAKSYAQIAGRNAVAAAISRRNIDGYVEENKIPGHYIVRRNIQENPSVSIIIPTKDRIDLLSVCISSIIENTTYKKYEIIVVNNQSEKKETYDYFEKMKDKIKVLDFNEPFNYSKMNNFAVENTSEELLLFLNNDTEIIEPNWLTYMVEQGIREDVGVVGAKLLYTNNTIQHAGVILGVGGVANHSFLNLPKDSHGYFGMLRDIRNCSAVTAACMLVRKKVFNEVNGFNEEALKVAFNDVDLCLKIVSEGYRCIWTPLAVLYHHESATRTRDVDLIEVQYMKDNWTFELENDPYYNKNFDRNEVVNSYSVFK
ncbi:MULTISPECIES: glycosyltransferase [Lysinibacillus]|uniref:glycosyltransferase n=1 Tax=Lysinibacillus TaxID=400634 RepID=UPI0021A8AC63|nr:glycosyltransferase [Lysinibacillus capsici]MCT1539296.1 glycosyltransferase [Lysinibacillus capsici]MCT1570636.1 glycosyltransferase [Lysinibacillus capsici]MCT1647456.1 glycosyltransferase [Lysinibacillus capsici]MCT1726266.1 glycosyltransferase [Lysinibacillus capsici]MCT1783370.1 glycosyltransferase [Lysinibacillus capsici]